MKKRIVRVSWAPPSPATAAKAVAGAVTSVATALVLCAVGLPQARAQATAPAPTAAARATSVPSPARAASAPAAATPRPASELRVIEDDQVRIEETRLRGQLQRVTVAPKGSTMRPYEINVGTGGRDPSQDKTSAGQRVWSVLRF